MPCVAEEPRQDFVLRECRGATGGATQARQAPASLSHLHALRAPQHECLKLNFTQTCSGLDLKMDRDARLCFCSFYPSQCSMSCGQSISNSQVDDGSASHRIQEQMFRDGGQSRLMGKVTGFRVFQMTYMQSARTQRFDVAHSTCFYCMRFVAGICRSDLHSSYTVGT